MTWHVEYDAALGVVHAMYAGHVSAEDFKNGTMKTMELARKHRTKLLLIDDSKLKSAVSKMEIYEMPLFYDQVQADRTTRMAIILPPSGKIRDDVMFYETVCRNRGWSAKVFSRRQDAVVWLVGTPQAKQSIPDC